MTTPRESVGNLFSWEALPGPAQMRFVTYNIHYGFGRDGNNDLERIADAVDGADVIALQEVERYWPRSGMVDQVARISKLLPDYWVAYGANIDLHSSVSFPGEANTARRQFGNMLLSRRPILASQNVALPRPPDQPQTMQRGALEVAIATAHGRPVRVYSVHLDYLSAVTRRVQLEALCKHHNRYSHQGGPWRGIHAVDDGWIIGDEPATSDCAILLGDLNVDAADIEYSDALSTMRSFQDAWALAGSNGSGATKDGQRIDHCWLSSGLAGAVRRAWVDNDSTGSDHQPAWFELEL